MEKLLQRKRQLLFRFSGKFHSQHSTEQTTEKAVKAGTSTWGRTTLGGEWRGSSLPSGPAMAIAAFWGGNQRMEVHSLSLPLSIFLCSCFKISFFFLKNENLQENFSSYPQIFFYLFSGIFNCTGNQ